VSDGTTLGGVPVNEANAILRAASAPGSKAFGIRRFPIGGEGGTWMPDDLASVLVREWLIPDDTPWRLAAFQECFDLLRGARLVDVTRRLAARYEDATAPPPPKWETALQEYVGNRVFVDPAVCVDIVRAALAEEAE